MSTSQLFLGPRAPPLHLYRHLLREASYLPPACRPFVDERIRHLFRKYRRPTGRTTHHLAKGRNRLARLRAANSGEIGSMHEVVFQAFGRKGPRRRAALKAFAGHDLPADTDALEDAIHDGPASRQAPAHTASAPPSGELAKSGVMKYFAGREAVKGEWVFGWDLDKVWQLRNSQYKKQRQSFLLWRGADIAKKPLSDVVPKENSWGRPTPYVSARAKLRKFWKGTIDKLVPPLPKAEWQFLEKLAHDRSSYKEWAIPPRRTVAGSQIEGNTANEAEPADAWDWRAYATSPVHVVERARTPQRARRGGKVNDGPYGRRTVAAPVTPRAMRRIFEQAFAVSSYLDTSTGDGRPVWGGYRLAIPAPTAAQARIFEGVDGQGKLRAAPARPRSEE